MLDEVNRRLLVTLDIIAAFRGPVDIRHDASRARKRQLASRARAGILVERAPVAREIEETAAMDARTESLERFETYVRKQLSMNQQVLGRAGYEDGAIRAGTSPGVAADEDIDSLSHPGTAEEGAVRMF